jgi:ATP-binding cassette subfamily C exporter for protease/lipase
MTPQPSIELSQAVGALRPQLRRATLFGLIAALLVLAPSAYMLEVYDRVLNSRNNLTLLMLTLLVVWAYVVMELLEWARARLLHQASLVLERKLGDRVFDASFTANLRGQPGGTPQSLTDFRTLREALFSGPVLALMELPVSVVFIVIIFILHPALGVAALVGALVQVLVGWLNERATRATLMKANQSAIAAQRYADGTLRNAQVVEAMGMQRDIYARWIAKQREFLNLQAVASEKAGGYQAVTRLVQLILASGILGLAAWLILNDKLDGSGGTMIVASILGARVVAPLVNIITQWKTVVAAREAWARVQQLLTVVPAPKPAMPLPPPRGQLQVESLVAGAPGGAAPILRGLNFAVKPGEVLAVVGPSASGKSSLGRLLVGLWPANSGKVRLDGVDVFSWDKRELGPHIGYLPQDVELFEGTLAENIARFGEPDPASVEEAARAVGLHETILALPQGYDSPVGGDGAMLSGGQRQRVGLARAIYGKPVFVVLDEPNSSLDEQGDAALASAIRQLKSTGTTFVVMTHRTSVLAVADKMLVLRDGQMHAFGPRDEVLAALAKAAQSQQAQRGAAAPAQLANVS